MKKKLTITVDEVLIPEAKRAAAARGVSLSSLVEASLRELTGEEGPSFAVRWRGRFGLSDRDDPRYRALTDRYG